MSKDSSKPIKRLWHPWLGVGLAVFLFLGVQVVAGILVSIYPLLRGWSVSHAQVWLDNSLTAKIAYLALISVIIFVTLKWFLKLYGQNWKTLGLRRPKGSDALYSLAAFPVYVLIFLVLTVIIKALVPSLNLEQVQDLGFNGSYSGLQLIIIGLALVVLSPLTEEVIFRGLLYGSLKRTVPLIWAAVVTSLIFAAGHLPEGGSAGPLYIAAIDTFVLSLVLVYLREKTGGLWASIGLHALKNCIAFLAVFHVFGR